MRARPGEQGTMFPLGTKPQAAVVDEFGDAGALFDDFEGPPGRKRHRFKLWRTWDPTKPTVLFVMLNPSIADATKLDPTLRKCQGFAQRWGMGKMLIGNLYTVVSPYPEQCRDDPFANGDLGDRHLEEMAVEADMIVAAWGTQPWLGNRPANVKALLERHKQLRCIGRTKDGQPRHPLYRSYEASLEPYV